MKSDQYEAGDMEVLLAEVPPGYRERFVEIVERTDAVCRIHLNDEYQVLCREMAADVCQEGSPARGGKPEGWAGAIIYSVGWVNFLGDPSQSPHMTAVQVAKAAGVSEATLMNRSRVIRAGLGLVRFDPSFTLPSRLDDNPLVWMMEINGFIVDVRHAPHAVQKALFEAGRIPYVPAERERSAGNPGV